MTPRNSSSGIRLLLVSLLLCLLTLTLPAQRKLDAKGGLEAFLDTQWWLGLRAGSNLTNPKTESFYSVLSAIDYDAENLKKNYESFQAPGIQLGLDLTYYHRGISIGILPTFKRYRYDYDNSLEWITATDIFQTKYQVAQNLDYLEVPLVLKYDVLKSGNLRPFVQLGIQWGFAIGAEKSLTINHQEGTPAATSGGTISIDTKKDFKGFAAALAGIGASFDIGNIRMSLDFSYHYGLTSIIEKERLFTENQLTAVGDINDDIRLTNLQGNLSFLFPLRFIDTTFKSGR
ncbi:MAG: porin family protein [Cytophagales bacterium]|nr:porin family protein [Cytophagales bacterium]